jgi:2,4-dienoyl-CoA reductase-like NADH-dependent reductase (Old Yellow Enzyme family)
VDLVDCSSGGLVPNAKIPSGPNYQVRFASEVRKQCGIATGAVGLITAPEQAEAVVAQGEADAVFLAREFLRNPYWPQHAARVLRTKLAGPKQYGRAAT